MKYKEKWEQAELNQEKMETACRVALSRLSKESQIAFQLAYRETIDRLTQNSSLEHLIWDARKGTPTLTGK